MEILGYVGALFIGLVLGLTGGGGSILTVPILVYLMSINPVTATAYSLFIVGTTSTFGAIQNYRKNLVDIKNGFIFAIPSFIAVYLTRKFIVPRIPEIIIESPILITKDSFLMLFFAVIMVFGALTVLRKKNQNTNNEEKRNLTEDEKTEYGGTGSGTPQPPENEPSKQDNKPVDKLNQKQESAIKKIDNTIKNALKDHDITGTLKDMDGNPVPKDNGGYWDHMQEMKNTLRGLKNHADTLKNVNNPEAQAAYGRATDAINKIESALKGHGI